ncbi:type I polyketide synthase [Streptomyces chrestomyceticus]|uniref:type I polyketide synthase n=1 Tax=Streptomyces chrestomyceticus TaxID=68185 RepID=UPI0033FB6A87
MTANISRNPSDSQDPADSRGLFDSRDSFGSQDPSDLVAVVGMAGRFPGAPDTAGLWELLRSGGQAIGPVPADRWDAGEQLDPERRIQGVGGFLDGVDRFDAAFFGISPREAAAIDPQQRLLLEVGWRALEDAGQRASLLAGSRTGVYVGASWHDYELLREDRGARPTPHSLVGNALDVIAARFSYVFGLRGPSMAVETGCSSSLVALHLAAQALRQGEIDAAVVGATNLMLDPHVTVGLTHFGALSPDGRCKTFSASADGFVRGETVAALYVKTLRRALADGDRIHGVVLRTVVNNDGGGDSLVTPSPEGQEDLLRQAYGGGLLPPGAPTYVEAHGTGTGRGDPIEVGALGRVLGRDRGDRPLLVGSVKTNIGHLEAGAGMAGLFKLLLALRHRTLPPSLHAETLNPDIPFEELGVRVVREPVALPASGPLYMGVNSFGWGGTNAHVVVASPPEERSVGAVAVPRGRRAPQAREQAEPGCSRVQLGDGAELPVFVPLSAKDRTALAERARQLTDRVPETSGEVDGLAGTLAWRRDHFPLRAALTVTEPERLRTALDAVAAAADRGELTDKPAEIPDAVLGRARPHGRTAFVFPGQGSQWKGMGRELFRDVPLFADVVRRCAKALSPHVDWDLTAVFEDGTDDTWTTRIDMLQPTLWAMSLGLAELWRAAGVEPDVVLGHSQGEITAATLAGILSYEDAALVMARRSAIARRTSGRGRMLAVDLDREAALAALEGFEDSVALAVHNGPRSCVLSGDEDSVLMLKELLEAEGTYCRLVNVDYASHSPQMDELRTDLLAALEPARPRAGTVALMSTVRGRLLDGPELDAAYWVENLRRPVLFADAMSALLDDGVTHVVEISPHPVLAPAVEQLAAPRPEPAAVLTTIRRDQGDRAAVASALALGYVAGLEPFGALPRHADVPVPGYPLRPESHWVPRRPRSSGATRGFAAHLSPAPGAAGTWHGPLELSLTDQAWLGDHRVHGTAVLPGTAMLAVAVNTARARCGAGPLRLTDVAFVKEVALSEQPARLTAEWHADLVDGGRFRLLALPEGGGPWQLTAEARAYGWDDAADAPPFPEWGPEGGATGGAEEFYRRWSARGLDYGPAFQGVRQLRPGPEGEVLGEVVLADALRETGRPGELHPALWDGALQVALTLCEDLGGTGALVPTAVRRVRLLREPDEPVAALWSHAVRRADGSVDVRLFDAARTPLMVLDGLRLEPLPGADDTDESAGRLHHLAWLDLAGAADGSDAGQTGDQGPVATRWLVCGADAEARELGDALAAAGVEATVGGETGTFDGARVPDGIVFLAPRAESGPQEQEHALGRLADVVRACAELGEPPRLAVVTTGAQAVSDGDLPDPGGALFWGWSRVLRREHGELTPRVVDVAADDTAWAERCAAELLTDDGEDQVALRHGRRFGARLARGAASEERLAALPPQHTRPQPFRHGGVGADGRARHVPLTRRAPGAGEVEIEVTAAAVEPGEAAAVAQGRGTGVPLLGHACAGRVVAVGPDVTSPVPGDRVVAMGPGTVATHVTVRADHTRPVPAGWTDTDAAALPMALVTAWYGLSHLARLEAAETVLIRGAGGAFGPVAVQVAGALGARVLATARDADERAALRELGADAVYDARDLSWIDAVRAATGGRGVDVVLGPADGPGLEHGLAALAEDGRLIAAETSANGGHRTAGGGRGTADGGRLDAAALARGVTVAGVDAAGLLDRAPDRVARALRAAWCLLDTGGVRPVPYRTAEFAGAGEALRETTTDRAAQTCVLTRPGSVERVEPLVLPDGALRRDGTYLISGGLGALGLSLAEFLAAHGAGALVLLGRSAPGPEAVERLAILRAGGTVVETARCDVADLTALRAALAALPAHLPPVRGVCHAAGVLDDATVRTVTPGQIAAVVRPKADGARNLEAVTADEPLDCFVLFSSAAALFGNAGQAAYAAANAALDAFAESRRLRGLPALSVQWGPFTDTGLAAEDARRGARLAERGMGGFTTAEAWPALLRMLQRGDVVTGYVPLDLRQWFDAYPETAACGSWQWLREAARQGDGPGAHAAEFRDLLARVPAAERPRLVESRIRELAGRVLRLEPDAVGHETPFKTLGLDSLMSLELRNRLEGAFGLRLSPTLLWAYGTPKALAAALAEHLSTTAGEAA